MFIKTYKERIIEPVKYIDIHANKISTVYYLQILWKKIKITNKEYAMLNNIINRVKRQGGFEE